LTFGTDSLLAFLGVLQRYCSGKTSEANLITQLLGLPTLNYPVNRYPTTQGLHASFLFPGSLALSLSSWAHDVKHYAKMSAVFRGAERLQHLPSWTWAGWMGEIQWVQVSGQGLSGSHVSTMTWITRAARHQLWFQRAKLISPIGRILNIPQEIPGPDTGYLLSLERPYLLSGFKFDDDIFRRWQMDWGLSVSMTMRDVASLHGTGDLTSTPMFITRDSHDSSVWFLVLRRVTGGPESPRWERIGCLTMRHPTRDILGISAVQAIDQLPVRQLDEDIIIV
jgi:hypothetical protein